MTFRSWPWSASPDVGRRNRGASLGLMPGDTLIARVRGDGREHQLNLQTPVTSRAFLYRSSSNSVKDQSIDVRIPLGGFVAT